MVDPADLTGGLKARARLNQMEINPPKRCGSRSGEVRRYVEALYAELRSVREKGWAWKAIHAELSKVEGFPKVGLSSLTKVFADVDKEWEKKTGQRALSIRRNKPRKAA